MVPRRSLGGALQVAGGGSVRQRSQSSVVIGRRSSVAFY